ncbi:hypothetical protein GCM10027168_48700 [Streptomyces capparidis]
MSATPSAVPSTPCPPPFRGRIGPDARSGHYAVPRRYRLHLSPSGPDCLRIAVTHDLLGLDGAVPVTTLPAVPDAPGGGYLALRPLYEASAHRYQGPTAAPVLADDWTGRIVSTCAPDILRDLARRFAAPGAPELHPHDDEPRIRAVELLCAQGVNEAAQQAGRPGADPEAREAALGTVLHSLDVLNRALAQREYVLGDRLTAADVAVWVALVRLDTVHRWHLDAAAVHHLAAYSHVWAHARRLAARPAFGAHLDLDGIARRHHAHCRGLEAAGAAVRIVEWPEPAPPRVAAGTG